MQRHLHLMISDRKPDGIERGPEQFFKRYNRTHPELGGCKKDTGGLTKFEMRDELLTSRENWAILQNYHLEKNGHDTRVDHRSYQERGIDREPEHHLGKVTIKLMNREATSVYRAQQASGFE